MTTEKKPAPFSGKVGRLRYKVWTNRSDQGKERFSLDIFRSYQVTVDGNKQWREARTYSKEDLKLIPSILDEVTAYITRERA